MYLKCKVQQSSIQGEAPDAIFDNHNQVTVAGLATRCMQSFCDKCRIFRARHVDIVPMDMAKTELCLMLLLSFGTIWYVSDNHLDKTSLFGELYLIQ